MEFGSASCWPIRVREESDQAILPHRTQDVAFAEFFFYTFGQLLVTILKIRAAIPGWETINLQGEDAKKILISPRPFDLHIQKIQK